LETNLALVFDLSDYLDHEQQAIYSRITESLFTFETEYKKKVRLIVEEAQIYAPQRMPTSKGHKPGTIDPVLASQKIAKRGRKRAIDSLWATQRPASLNKDILSQCNRFWFGGISAEQDYKAIKPFLKEAGIEFAQLKALQPGEFYFYSQGETKKIKSRKRLCKHGGATPQEQEDIRAVSSAGLEKALEALAEQLKQNQLSQEEETSELIELKRALKELEDENARLKDELNKERLATKVIRRIEVPSINAPQPAVAVAVPIPPEMGISAEEAEEQELLEAFEQAIDGAPLASPLEASAQQPPQQPHALPTMRQKPAAAGAPQKIRHAIHAPHPAAAAHHHPHRVTHQIPLMD
ncbi:MAG: ATP-binding protein, partial [Cyanobacteria bacterium HKST-UBA06]|nr:ATP-binding protein [Cyanobacteria bacterium HKST-UBA06]